jgi:ABC-type Fe3+-siderophore transport system permease subunit
MVEILILYGLGRAIAAKAREAGRSGTSYAFLLHALWFCGEIIGGVLVMLTAFLFGGGKEPSLLLVYGGALIGGAIGAVTAFLIVTALLPVDPHDDFEPNDDSEPRVRCNQSMFKSNKTP